MFRPTRVKIDRDALKNNIAVLKQANGADFFCPMVKANAYGHGDAMVCHEIERCGVDAFGVALVEEGLKLRTAGIQSPILVFAPFDKVGASAMVTHRLTPVLTRFEDLEAVASLQSKTALGVHLKFNTGMCRLGFDASELEKLRIDVAKSPHLKIEGLCTHLTHGEEAHLPQSLTQKQLEKFEQMTKGFPGVKHAHKSASLGALEENSRKKPAGIGSRPGISLFGLPYEGMKTMPGLKPVLEWTAQLARVHSVAQGEAVGYSAAWKAKKPSQIGVIAAGYGDGYMRALSNTSSMLFRGGRVPVVGQVCMDYIFLDLTDMCREGAPQAGEEIVLIGQQGDACITAGELAELAGTISYEIVTNISARVAREAE